MPPPKKPKGSWEEFISKSQADSSADQQEDSFGSHNTDNRPFNRSVGIEKKGLVDCSSSFTRPEALVTLAPVDLSLKPDRKNTLSNSIPVALKETITPSGRAHIQDSNPYAENHPQLRNILLHASSDPILSDIGENLVSSGSQDFHVTRIHSCPSGSLTSSKILWRNPSMQASATKLQPQTAFSTNMPSGGNNRDQGCLLDSSRRERVQNLSCLQIKQENDCFRLDRQDHNPSSGNIVRNTLPLAMVNSNSGYSDSVREKMLTERYSTSPTNGPCDQDRRNGFATQDGTADSTTHLIFNSSQMKRSRFNGERAQVRHQALRGQGSTTEHIEHEPHARGPITNNLICLGRGNLGQERPRNPAPEFNSSESQSLSQKTIARLFDELHRKDSPVTEYLVSLDDELQRPQILSNAAERILAQMQSKPRIPRLLQTSLNGKPQNEDGFGQGKVENGSVIDKKLFPTSARPRLASHRKMTTLRELLCDDSGPIINSSSATPSGEVNGVNIADSCAAHRLQETGDLERMEDNRTRSIGGCPESFESENSSELPALVMITDIHSSPEMPSSSSSNERAKNKADAKGVCRCQICDDVASGFHYGVWSCEGCKAFFKRSLHGPVDYVCPATNNCTIDKLRRKSCQACRLRKCHEAGMTAGISRKEKGIRLIGKKRKAAEEELSTSDDPEAAASSSCLGKLTRYDSVGSSHDVDQKPNLASVEEMNPSPPSPPSPALNPLVERLLAIELPPREAEFNDSITEFSALHLLSGLLGLINCQLVDIINWSKALTEFSKSSLESRTRLLVASWSELLILSTVWQSIPQPNVWVCAPNLLLTRAHCKVAMIETLFDQIMSLVQTFRRLQLTETELVLLRLTILLNSGFSVIESQPALANLRNLLDETWQQIPPDASSRSRLSHLLLTLPDIRQCSLMMHNVIDSARHRQGVPTYNLLLEMLDCDVLRMSDMQAADVVMEDLD